MSAVERAIRQAFADPGVDFVSVGRTQQGDFFASVKRNGRGFGVYYASDPAAALEKAITAPDAVGPAAVAIPLARATAVKAKRIVSPPTIAAIDDDLFG